MRKGRERREKDREAFAFALEVIMFQDNLVRDVIKDLGKRLRFKPYKEIGKKVFEFPEKTSALES